MKNYVILSIALVSACIQGMNHGQPQPVICAFSPDSSITLIDGQTVRRRYVENLILTLKELQSKDYEACEQLVRKCLNSNHIIKPNIIKSIVSLWDNPYDTLLDAYGNPEPLKCAVIRTYIRSTINASALGSAAFYSGHLSFALPD